MKSLLARRLSPFARLLRIEPLEARRLLSVATGEQAVELFGMSPAVFVENQGQWADDSVRFVHQGDGANVAMTDTGPVFEIRRVGTAHQEQEQPSDNNPLDNPFDEPFDDAIGGQCPPYETTRFSAQFNGANTVVPVGLELSQSRFNQ